MTLWAWRIAEDTPRYTSEDLSGEGARISGGRWNSPGLAVTYASRSIALACLETAAHLKSSTLPLNRYLVRIDIPDAVLSSAIELDVTSADKVGWDAIPPGLVSLRLGDQWLKSAASAVLLVPSVIVPEEWNLLINPAHPQSATINATKIRKWLYDPRAAS